MYNTNRSLSKPLFLNSLETQTKTDFLSKVKHCQFTGSNSPKNCTNSVPQEDIWKIAIPLSYI